MKIYTSFFGNVKKIEEAGVVPVSISLYPPKWRKWTELRIFAPTKSILFESKGDDDYTQRFKAEILNKLNPQEVKKLLQTVTGGKDFALLCFERPGDFCHRHLVAQWLREEVGLGIEEFSSGNLAEKKCKCQGTQLSLFE